MAWDLVEKREWVRGRERFTNFGSWSVGENEALATGYDLERERGERGGVGRVRQQLESGMVLRGKSGI